MKLNIQLFADGSVEINVDLNTKSFDAQISLLETKLENLTSEYETALKDPDFDPEGLQEYEAKIQDLVNKIVDLKDKQNSLNDSGGGLEGVKNSMGDIIKKVAKWGLAIFSIRSAYNFVKQSVSTLSQYNKNLGKDIENIRYGLASALAPVILKIVEWAQRLIQIVNYIWRKLFGKNLFSDIPRNLKSGNKEAKKLQKTLAGFDEMNVLNEQSSGGGTSGGGTTTHKLTDTDLIDKETMAKLDTFIEKVQEFTTNVKENKSSLSTWGPILAGIFSVGLLSRLVGLTGAGGGFIKVLEPLAGKLVSGARSGILGLGKGLISLSGSTAGSIAQTSGLAKALGVTASGIPALVGGLALLDTALILHIVNVIRKDVAPAVKEAHKMMDEAKEGMNDTTKATKKLNDKTLEYADSVKAGDETLSRNIDFMMKKIRTTDQEIAKEKEQLSVAGALTGENKVHKKAIEELDKQMWANINTLGKLAQSNKLTNEQAQQFVNTCENEIEKLEKQNSTLNENSKQYQANKEKIEQLKAQIDLTKGNYDVIVSSKTDQKPIDKMKTAVDNLDGEYKVEMNADTNKANKKVSGWLSNLNSVGILGNFVKAGISLSNALSKFKYHAKGGIINLPGRGVPITHMGGEAGKEGIVPLTDSQQMELLGEAIGRYITINANITNTMNGRVISRELIKIQKENNFANNR